MCGPGFLSNSAHPHSQNLSMVLLMTIQECLSNAKCHKAVRRFFLPPSG